MPNYKTFDTSDQLTTYEELVRDQLQKGFDIQAVRIIGAWAALATPYIGALAERWQTEIEPLLTHLQEESRIRRQQRNEARIRGAKNPLPYAPFDVDEVTKVIEAIREFPDWRAEFGLEYTPTLD